MFYSESNKLASTKSLLHMEGGNLQKKSNPGAFYPWDAL